MSYLKPGLYFRDEVVWRGRVMASMHGLTATLYEMLFYIGAMYLAFASSKWLGEWPMVGVGIFVCLRLLLGSIDGHSAKRKVSNDIENYFDERYPREPEW